MQKNIIEDYKDDIIKYADDSDKSKIRLCFNSIPKHLAQENKKFRYSLVDKNGNTKKYFGSLEWLYDAGTKIMRGYKFINNSWHSSNNYILFK